LWAGIGRDFRVFPGNPRDPENPHDPVLQPGFDRISPSYPGENTWLHVENEMQTSPRILDLSLDESHLWTPSAPLFKRGISKDVVSSGLGEDRGFTESPCDNSTRKHLYKTRPKCFIKMWRSGLELCWILDEFQNDKHCD
jgi:hypothetical protein